MELVIIRKMNKKEMPVTTSKIISDKTNNSHRSIQRLLTKFENDFSEFGKVRFRITPSQSGQKENIYFLNEQQATLLITYLRNSDIVRKFKIELVKDFYRMRKFIEMKHTREWKDTRQLSKDVNSELNDVVKLFTEYAELKGSVSFKRYYGSYQNLLNKSLGIESGNRDNMSPEQMNKQRFITQFLYKTIQQGIQQDLFYKDIYQDCKSKVEYFTKCLL